MGQLFERINRLVKAELRQGNSGLEGKRIDAGSAIVAGGAVAGSSIGKVGVLAGGTGYSVGTLPLTAAGALTGAAIYEILRSLIEGDSSSASAAAIGATAGAATSAIVGGVGVTVGGTAVGVGIISMAATGAVAGVGLLGLYHLVQQGIDPEQLLEEAIEEMEADLGRFRQTVIHAIASHNLVRSGIVQAETEVDKWQQRAKLAVEKDRNDLAREALIRKKGYVRTIAELKDQLDHQESTVKNLKQNLYVLESKMAEARQKKSILKEKLRTILIQENMRNFSNRSSTDIYTAFGSAEEKPLQMEARSKQALELPGASLEEQFALLESGTDFDDELEALKRLVLGENLQSQAQTSNSQSATSTSFVDMELEELRKKLEQL